MPTDTETKHLRIETGRSWRDLPTEPPTTAPDRLRPITQPTEEVPGRSWPWARIGVGALALAIGISVGVWSPWTEDASSGIEPLAADELPETIVPETPEELVPDPNPSEDPFRIAPEDFGTPEEFFDQLPDGFRDSLPDGFFEGAQSPFQDQAGLIELNALPDGYQARSNVYSQSGDRASQRIRLLGPDGSIDVQAIRGPEVVLPDVGEPVAVAGTEGRLVSSDGSTTVSWLAEPGLLITVEAPTTIADDILIGVADAVEVRP